MKYTYILLICMLFGTSCVKSPKNIQHDVDVIITGLESCPSWYLTARSDTETRNKITFEYKKLCQYDSETIRRAFVKMEERNAGSTSNNSFELGAKQFVFLRLVFNIPPAFSEELIPDGWGMGTLASWGSPIRKDPDGIKYNYLWPYEINSSGKFVLAGASLRMYMGPPYDPIADFDVLAKHYQRRDPKDIR